MEILQNARHERFAQNLAKGMSADASHTAAGYKPNRKNAARPVGQIHSGPRWTD